MVPSLGHALAIVLGAIMTDLAGRAGLSSMPQTSSSPSEPSFLMWLLRCYRQLKKNAQHESRELSFIKGGERQYHI